MLVYLIFSVISGIISAVTTIRFGYLMLATDVASSAVTGNLGMILFLLSVVGFFISLGILYITTKGVLNYTKNNLKNATYFLKIGAWSLIGALGLLFLAFL